MNLILKPILENDKEEYIKSMQEAFQKGAEAEFGNISEEILPRKDVENSLSTKGSIAYKAILNNKIVGGAIVIINQKTNYNHLDFLFVKNDVQSKGIGQKIWQEIEKLHPETLVWETVTPYFEKRNIHFYINRCHFKAIEFFNPHHKDESFADEDDDNMVGMDYFFRFEKNMN